MLLVVLSLTNIPLSLQTLQLRLRLLLALKGEEEEKFVAPIPDVRNHDGATESAPVLVPLQDRSGLALLVVKEVVRIEVGIAYVVVKSAV